MAKRQSAGRSRAPSQRQLRVGEELRHVISAVLARGDVRDPDVEGRVITVTEVRASPDLKHATVFVLPLGLSEGGQKAETSALVDGLRRSAKFLRGQAASQLHLKYMPEIHFEMDTSFDNASHIEGLLHSKGVARDLAREDPGDDAAT